VIGGRFLDGLDTMLADFDNRDATTTTHPWITITGPERSHFGSFGFPEFSSPGATAGYYGPNFTFTPIPEPGTLALLGCGVAGFGIARLSAQKASRVARDRHRRRYVDTTRVWAT
jgi:hypothetical protein